VSLSSCQFYEGGEETVTVSNRQSTTQTTVENTTVGVSVGGVAVQASVSSKDIARVSFLLCYVFFGVQSHLLCYVCLSFS